MLWPVYSMRKEGYTREATEISWVGTDGAAVHWVGVNNVTVFENDTFDPMDGVSATDKDGNPLTVTYTGTVDTSTPGVYELTYKVTVDGEEKTRKRRVTVKVVEPPHFTGLTEIRVKQGAPIDLDDGVHAWMDTEEIPFTFSPNSVDECAVGTHTITYTATSRGKTTTETRNVVIEQAEAPTIYGNTPMNVFINTDFDPLADLTAKDANGGDVPVEYDCEIYTLTRTVSGTDTTVNYIEDTEVPLRKPVLTDRQRFDGWFDNASMTGTPIESVTMNADKQVWCKIVDLEAYASYDSATKTFRVFVDEAGKYTNGQVVGTITYYADWESTSNPLPWTSESWITAVTTARIDDVIHPTKMQSFFSGMSALASITGLWRIDTTNVASFVSVFSNTSSLAKAIDLSTWNISNGGSGVNCSNMFNGSGVTSVNICGWDASNVVNISGMFRQCTGLTTIYASAGFDLSSMADSFAAAVFTGDTNLVGGEGTVYDSNFAKQQYARIDGGVDAPGYFTEK